MDNKTSHRLLEIDSNPNPLRTLTCGALARIDEGTACLTGAPGLGIVQDLEAFAHHAVA